LEADIAWQQAGPPGGALVGDWMEGWTLYATLDMEEDDLFDDD
jgi:hypothetical protein